MSVSRKAVIPHNVADAIESFRSEPYPYGNKQIIICVTSGASGVNAATLRTIPFDTLLSALVNGYEREKTEEDMRQLGYAQIRQLYEMSCGGDVKTAFVFRDGYERGIKQTLAALNIKIEGVNA